MLPGATLGGVAAGRTLLGLGKTAMRLYLARQHHPLGRLHDAARLWR